MKKFLITGASSGIGKAISESLLMAGHEVVGFARDFSKYRPDSNRFTAVEIDFSELDELPEKLTALNLEFSKNGTAVSGIICCAGRGLFKSLEEFSYKQIRELMDLNFTSQVFFIRAFLPALKQQDHSNIIMMSSIAGLRGDRKGTIYSASKFALRGFAQALRDESARSGVHVTVINPGMVKTPFFDEMNFGPGEKPSQHITAADIAAQVCAVLALRPGSVVDEITISQLQKVIQFDKHQSNDY